MFTFIFRYKYKLLFWIIVFKIIFIHNEFQIALLVMHVSYVMKFVE